MVYFWLTTGFMAGIAAAFFVVQLWRHDATESVVSVRHSRWVVAAAVVSFALVAMAIYFKQGRPELAEQGLLVATSNHGQTSGTAAATTGSMVEVAAKLAAKLADGGGSDADWQLLQQSYAFLGDTEAAALAQQHKLRLGSDVPQVAATADSANSTRLASAQVSLASYQQLVASKPDDAAAWLAIAYLQRTARDFSAASSAFEKVIKLKAMDADAWADYADVAASIAKTLTNTQTRKALDAALQLEPQHNKALWLKASLAHEEGRYNDALKFWQQLRATLPDGSPDVSVIDANIKEAQSLVGGTAPLPQTNKVAQVSGSVVLDPKFKNISTADMTLFVYAKAPDSPAPVAAYRARVSAWPVKFVLDDARAMMPTRKLSQFDTVTVSARLSRSGQAAAQSGDLQSEIISIATSANKSVVLKINQQVP
jgi:cytochrome c-type biogenesis protein CcmH/NrfG